jgi:hypothetical protein
MVSSAIGARATFISKESVRKEWSSYRANKLIFGLPVIAVDGK